MRGVYVGYFETGSSEPEALVETIGSQLSTMEYKTREGIFRLAIAEKMRVERDFHRGFLRVFNPTHFQSWARSRSLYVQTMACGRPVDRAEDFFHSRLLPDQFVSLLHDLLYQRDLLRS